MHVKFNISGIFYFIIWSESDLIITFHFVQFCLNYFKDELFSPSLKMEFVFESKNSKIIIFHLYFLQTLIIYFPIYFFIFILLFTYICNYFHIIFFSNIINIIQAIIFPLEFLAQWARYISSPPLTLPNWDLCANRVFDSFLYWWRIKLLV